MKIWERYFFFDTLKVLCFFLFAFAGLYVLIDYASHTGNFHHHQVRFTIYELAIFYTGELLRRSEVLLPFAILIATIRVMTKLNTRNELVALLAAGIPMKRLLRPFIYIGLLGVMLLYINEEFLIPWSLESARSMGENATAHQTLKAEVPSAHHVSLEDESLLIFQTYHPVEKEFYDVWWVRSIDEMWRIKTLKESSPHQATEVEVFTRLPSGALVSKERFKERELPEIQFNPKRLLETITPAEELSISELAKKMQKEISSEKEARVETAFWRKILLPWLALFAVIAPAPYAVHFTRHLNTFAIYALSLFALVFCYIALNAATTLSDRQVLTPQVALFVPFFIVVSWLSISWIRLK